MALISFYAPWKHQKTSDFLVFSESIERDQWHVMGWGQKLLGNLFFKLFATLQLLINVDFTFKYISNLGAIWWWLQGFMASRRPPLFYRPFLIDMNSKSVHTAWKVSVIGVFVVRIFQHLGWIRKNIPIGPKSTQFFILLRLFKIALVRLYIWRK